jgi:hypothetical protein
LPGFGILVPVAYCSLLHPCVKSLFLGHLCYSGFVSVISYIPAYTVSSVGDLASDVTAVPWGLPSLTVSMSR